MLSQGTAQPVQIIPFDLNIEIFQLHRTLWVLYKTEFFLLRTSWSEVQPTLLFLIVNVKSKAYVIVVCSALRLLSAIRVLALVIVHVCSVWPNWWLLFVFMKKWQCLLSSEVVNCLDASYSAGKLLAVTMHAFSVFGLTIIFVPMNLAQWFLLWKVELAHQFNRNCVFDILCLYLSPFEAAFGKLCKFYAYLLKKWCSVVRLLLPVD